MLLFFYGLHTVIIGLYRVIRGDRPCGMPLVRIRVIDIRCKSLSKVRSFTSSDIHRFIYPAHSEYGLIVRHRVTTIFRIGQTSLCHRNREELEMIVLSRTNEIKQRSFIHESIHRMRRMDNVIMRI